MTRMIRPDSGMLRKPLIAAAVAAALIGAQASAHEGRDGPQGHDHDQPARPTVVEGVVAGSLFTPPTATAVGSSAASVYAGAKVCFDLNRNGACDRDEPSAVTGHNGKFELTSRKATGPLIAEIPTGATNGGKPVTQRLVLRAPRELLEDDSPGRSPVSVNVAITPLSTEVARSMEADHLSYFEARDNIAERLGVASDDLLSDPAKVRDASDRSAILQESTILTGRFELATRALDRGDYHSLAQAEQASMNIEGIPRYDHIFIVMLENKATSSILDSPYAPHINALLKANNQFTNYFATGNPSEPNYTALGGADDFGITDDDQWNCFATGANAPQDLPLPTNDQPGLASSPFSGLTTAQQVSSSCGSSNVNHNIVDRPNLFVAMENAGLSWRTYNESTNPGQDFRTDSVADAAVVASDHVYAPGTLNGNTTPVGSATLNLPLPAGLYKTKHNPAMAFQNARSQADFKANNRTMGGGQWDAVYKQASAYAIPAHFNVDQFGTDLYNGDIGALNYVIPDQCDDMHSITVKGTDSSTGASLAASDCSGVANGNDPPPDDQKNNIITRGDNYVQYLVNKIEASPTWKNRNEREAIVLMFDEGSATDGVTNSCCGWNPGNSNVAKPLLESSDGSFSVDNSVVNYTHGNRGHGNSIFVVITNQPHAPKRIKDSDAYSHFSFVRTLQDMFGLSDPKVDGSYMNRSKYTESFIAANIANLPEYAGSADTHFDSVRPMNHQYVIPAGYTERQSTDSSIIQPGTQPAGSPPGNPAGTVAPQVGPDANQINVWALK